MTSYLSERNAIQMGFLHKTKSYDSSNTPLIGGYEAKANALPSHRSTLTLLPPLLIIAGQLVILSLAWGFAIVCLVHGPVPLPDNWAELANTSPRALTLILTLIGTIFSLISAYLFGEIVRYALQVYLVRPVSMSALAFGIKMAGGIALIRRRHLSWTACALVCVLMLSTMTAGWAALITPTYIVVERNITGTELDLGSPAFAKLLSDSWTFANDDGAGGTRSGSAQIVSPAMEASGLAASGALFNSPATVNFNGALFNISTGGILPTVKFNGLNMASKAAGPLNFGGGLIPQRYKINGKPWPNVSGFNTNYTIYQQGFTADISCEQMNDTSDTAHPSLTNDTVTMAFSDYEPVLHLDANIVKWMWSTSCPNGAYAYQANFLTINGSEYPSSMVPGNVCNYQNMSSPANSSDHSTHLLVFKGIGPEYSFINQTVCSIRPRLTKVKVDYGSVANVSEIVNSAVMVENTTIEYGSLGYYASHTIRGRFASTQTLQSNGFGDSIANLYLTRSGNVSAQDQPKLLNSILEENMRGMTELMGTFLRSGFSAGGVFPGDKIPSNMSTEFAGTLSAGTMGWDTRQAASLISLVPITFIALLSIAIAVHSIILYQNNSHRSTGLHHSFDATNSFELIAAASAGGLRGTFSDVNPGNLARHQEIAVQAEIVDGEHIGLVPAPQR